MSAYKKLNQQDAYISTYVARKSWVASGSQFLNLGIQNIVGLSGSGVYIPNSIDNFYGGNISNSGSTSYNRRLIFESIDHLYYSQFKNSVLTTSSSYENYLQSSFEVSGSRYINEKIAVFSIPKELYGIHLEPNSISITIDLVNGENATGSLDNYVEQGYVENGYFEDSITLFGTSGSNDNKIIDDGEGRLYVSSSNPRNYVGNVIYPHGQIIITDDTIASYYNSYFDPVLSWKSNLPIYTHNFHCKIKTGEFNNTLNKTALDGKDGKIADLISGSDFQPYITTVGLYNDANELIAVGKLGQPIPKSAETDMVINVKLDMNFGVNRLSEGRSN